MTLTPFSSVRRSIAAIRSGFTLIELLVVIAIIAIFAAILFPVFAQAREKARQASCLSNTKQLGLGIYQYVQDYDETIPNGGWRAGTTTPGSQSRWYRDVYPYIKSVGVFTCPSKNDGNFIVPYSQPNATATIQVPGPASAGGYGINVNLVGYPYCTAEGCTPPPLTNPSKTLADIRDSAGTFLICEAAQTNDNTVTNRLDPASWIKWQLSPTDWQVTVPSGWSSDTADPYGVAGGNGNETRRPMARHNGGLNVIYCDGHAKWSKIEQFLGITAARPKGWPYGDPNNSWDNK